MDLTSRKAVRDGMKKYGFIAPDMTVHEFVEDELPSVSAVPLDKLCEWLGKFANPCKIGIRCYYPDDNNEDCMPTVECWRYVLTKWMEEQYAKEKS